MFASLREFGAHATPPLTRVEELRSRLATARATPPPTTPTPSWIRMTRRAFQTPAHLLANVALQATERKLFYGDTSPSLRPGLSSPSASGS
jgi:hypothetical protein